MGIPNILSVFRLALAPVFVIVYFSGIAYAHVYAAIVYVVASITDVVDGAIARKFNMTSELGKILDPLGDKVMTFSVLICITVDRLIPIWVVIIFAMKELLMGIGGLVLHKKMSEIPHSNYFGKAATVVFFVVCTLLMVFSNIPKSAAYVMITIAVIIMVLALFSYIFTFYNALKDDNNSKN